MIFFHSSFRTSSTYIWSRFRQIGKTVSYCEIFHEILSSINHQNINAINHETWDSKHPSIAPYFLEFLPFIQDAGGVVNFRSDFSYDRYIPEAGPRGNVSDEEATYVRGLVDHAEQRGRVPVLTETRSLGRVAGLKSAAAGLHVVLYRNLHQQWCSYTEQSVSGNHYFVESIEKIIQNNLHDDTVRYFSKIFPIDKANILDINTFYNFLFLHMYLYIHAADAADLILDTNQLATDAGYRAEIENIFLDENLRVDFSDARQSTAYSLVELPSKDHFFEQVKTVSDFLCNDVTSKKSSSFMAKIIDDFLEEYDRHEFYNKRIRSVLTSALLSKKQAQSETDDVRQYANAVRNEYDICAADRDRLSRERDDARLARGQADHRVAVLESERDALSLDRDRLARERDKAVAAAGKARRQARTSKRESTTPERTETGVESDG